MGACKAQRGSLLFGCNLFVAFQLGGIWGYLNGSCVREMKRDLMMTKRSSCVTERAFP